MFDGHIRMGQNKTCEFYLVFGVPKNEIEQHNS